MQEQRNYCLWKPVEGGAKLIKVFGFDTRLRLPKALMDNPITEIGPYCFADRMPDLPDGMFLDQEPCSREELSLLIEGHQLPPAITGNAIESVFLPDEAAVLHNACFYNCRSLQSLSLGPGISGIGSDVFTNDRNLSLLVLRSSDREKTGLPLILERITDDITVHFQEDGRIVSALFFPEYYEWLDEITPAHWFSRSVHGEGFRMRKAFSDKRISYDRYDECFPSALLEESPASLIRIALNRLLYPVSLSQKARDLYRDSLEGYLPEALAMAISETNASLLSFLLRDFSPESGLLDAMRDLAIEKEWSEGAALIIGAKQTRGSGINFDLEW